MTVLTVLIVLSVLTALTVLSVMSVLIARHTSRHENLKYSNNELLIQHNAAVNILHYET